jgi:hypothetical protein
MADEFDPTQMSDQELLSLPESNIPPAKLGLFLARRSEIIEKREAEGIALGLTPGYDGRRPTRDGAQAEQDEQRVMQRYLLAVQDFCDREDRLIETIEDERRETLRHLQEIDDRAIKLHDGRRAYVDGSNYRDKDGVFLLGNDKDEADRLRTGTSSTWAEKSQYDLASDTENHLLRNLREDRQKLNGAMNNRSHQIDSERVDDLKEHQALLSQYEKQTDELTKSYGDYAAAYGTADSRRTASFSGTLDSEHKQQSIGREFAAVSAPQPANLPDQERLSTVPSPQTAPRL